MSTGSGNVSQIGTDLMHNHDFHDPQVVLQRTAVHFDDQAPLTEDELNTICLAVDGSGIPNARNRLHAHWTRILISKLQADLA